MTGFTPKQVSAWKADPVKFAREVLWHRGPDGVVPWVPHPGQEEVLRALAARENGVPRYKVVCWSAPKRSGKSALAGAALAWVLLREGARSFVLSVSREQAASVVFDELKGFIRHSPLLAQLIPEDSRQSAEVRCPVLDSIVQVLPAKETTIQGRSPGGGLFVLDESHSQDRGLFDMALSQCDRKDAQAFIVSMMGSPAGNTYRLYEVDQSGADPLLWFRYSTGCENPHVSSQWLASRKASLPPAIYRVLHENAPGEGADALFDAEALLNCRVDVAVPSNENDFPDWCREVLGVERDRVMLGYGLDRAQPGAAKGDSTVACLLAAWDEGSVRRYCVLRSDVIQGGAEDRIMAHAEGLVRMYGPLRAAVVEAYQAADLAGRLPAVLGREVTLKHATTGYQEAGFTHLWQAVNEGRIMLPKELEALFTQLVAFTIDTSGKTLRFTGGAGRGVDDHVYALLAASSGLEAVPSQFLAGVSAGFVTRRADGDAPVFGY